jgi:anti-sigma regulatory factor (Ser/Thr protein kinase)
MATDPSGSLATSTQLPFGLLCSLLRQLASGTSRAGMPLYFLISTTLSPFQFRTILSARAFVMLTRLFLRTLLHLYLHPGVGPARMVLRPRRQSLMSARGTIGVPVPAPPAGHQGIVSAEWPFRDAIELGPFPGAVPCARLHVRHVLWEWGLTGLASDAELLVSELVTNAISAPQPADQVSPVRIWLLAGPALVLILVWDASLRPPAPVTPDEDTESGRGLLLVEAVSQRWGWYFPGETGGKVVWALMAQREDTDSAA